MHAMSSSSITLIEHIDKMQSHNTIKYALVIVFKQHAVYM